MTPQQDPSKKPHGRARRIVAGTESWWWLFGGNGIILWSPTGQKFDVHMTALNGMTWENYERALWKKWGGDEWAIHPKHVRAFIDRVKADGIRPRPPGIPKQFPPVQAN